MRPSKNFFSFILIATWETSCYFLISAFNFIKANRNLAPQQPFIVLAAAFFLTFSLSECAYQVTVTSKDAKFLSLLNCIGIGILETIFLLNQIAILYKQQILLRDINSEPSPNLTPKATSETNQNIPELELVIAKYTTKLEDAINQLRTELSQQLQIKESLLGISQAAEEISEAICITDTDGFPTYTNKAFLQLFGYSIEDLNAVGGIISLFASSVVGQEIHSLILNGYSWNGEVEMRAHHSQRIQVALRAEVVKNQTSQVTGIVTIYTNITEDKQANATRQENQKYLRIALEAVGMATWNWNLRTRKISWACNLEPVLGINPEMLEGDSSTLAIVR